MHIYRIEYCYKRAGIVIPTVEKVYMYSKVKNTQQSI